MSEREVCITYKAVALLEALDIAAISELCFAILRRVLRFYSSQFPEESRIQNEVYRFLANLHMYLCSMGMTPFFNLGARARIEIQCITLLYRESDDGEIPLSFQGITVFEDLLRNHPKMVLDFAIEAMTETIIALKIRQPRQIGPEVFIEQIKTICGLISTSERIAPLIVPRQGAPCAIVRLKVFPSI